MNENNKLALLLGYYAARFDRAGIAKLGFKTFSDFFKTTSELLHVNENSIRNMRDEFDPYFDNPRSGFNRVMSPSRKFVYETFKTYNENDIFEIIHNVISGDYEEALRILEKIDMEDKYMLKDLHVIAEISKKKYSQEFSNQDIKLSDSFRHSFGAIIRKSGQSVVFNEGTVVITTTGNLKIYAPNQWFSMALYMKDYVVEAIKYKETLDKVLDNTNFESSNAKKEYIKSLKDTNNESLLNGFEEIVKNYFKSTLTDEDEIESCTKYIIKFATDYSWWYGSKTIDRGDYYVSPVLNLLGVVNASQSYVADIAYYFATNKELIELNEGVMFENINNTPEMFSPAPSSEQNTSRKTGGHNLIIYGAPGTGKSRTIEDRYGLEPYTKRVVFHPEYSYFDFVGSYKPVSLYKKTEEMFFTVAGEPFVKGEPYIDYQFVPGPFIQVFIDAWKDPAHMHTLLIEEINRASAAAVFGEIFQMLDRLADGSGEYKLTPPKELKDYLCSIDEMSDHIKSGLYIPSNMNIVATMNSADQGVNVIDSAFKRRWNFEYLPIDINKAVHKDAIIIYAGTECKWGTFVSALNDKLINNQVGEDKLIGPYFIRPEEVNSKCAIDKLLLYLWDDIFRHARDLFFDNTIKQFSELTEKFKEQDVLKLSKYFDEKNIALENYETEEETQEEE